MSSPTSIEAADSEASGQLRAGLPGADAARTLVIAGSGLGGFVKTVDVAAELSYGQIPGVGDSTVAGHSGRLIFGYVGPGKTPAIVMAGRRHLYEGLSPAEATLLPRLVLSVWPGIRNMLVSNAAGGLNPTFAVGDLMLIADHINWTFQNLLEGSPANLRKNCDVRHRPVYDPDLQTMAQNAGTELGIALRQGTYLSMMGPSYETRAEIAMIRHVFGADAVGMSTVPEATLSAAMGRRVLGISFISNMLVEPAPLTHEEVVQNSALVENKFSALVASLLEKLHFD